MSNRPRLPKKFETFYFFRITRPEFFKKHLATLVPVITTADDAFKMREDIYKSKANGTYKGIVTLSAVNVAFSSKGLAKVGLLNFSSHGDLFLTSHSLEPRASPMKFSTTANIKI